jgi:hypothetical protein
MARLNLTDIGDSENRIQELKNDIVGISEERWRAALSRNENAVVKARIKASEKTIENCDAIASYLNNFSSPLSNEIRKRGEIAKASLGQIKSTANAQELQKWIKTELIPSTKMSERLAHLAATSIRKAQGEDLEFYKWSSRPR